MVDTTPAIVIAGLVTALSGTLAVPFITDHFTSKREAASRVDERRHATYVDAITFVQLIEARLNDLTEDPLYRERRDILTCPTSCSSKRN